MKRAGPASAGRSALAAEEEEQQPAPAEKKMAADAANHGAVSASDDDIWQALCSLRYAGCRVKSAADLSAVLSSVNHNDPAFTELVVWLTKELADLCGIDERVHPPDSSDELTNVSPFMLELSAFLKEANCPIESLMGGNVADRLNDVNSKRTLIDYLRTEVQAARILAIEKELAAPKNQQMNGVAAGSAVAWAEHLKQALKSLGFPKPRDDLTVTTLFQHLTKKIGDQLAALPEHNKKAVTRPLFRGHLSSEQWAYAANLNRQLRLEHKTRAQLLLKRLDVTVQSFSWSDRVKKMEENLARMYRPLRNNLATESAIDVADLLAARYDLSLVEKTCGTRVLTSSKVNKVLMKGRVPDRGGRPTEIEAPPPEMPPWQKERAQGRGGGRGGGFGGRGGGGGGRVQRGGGGGGRGGGGDYGRQVHHQQGGFHQQAPQQQGHSYQYQQQQQVGYGGGLAHYQAQQQAAAYGGYAAQQAYYDSAGGAGGGGFQQQQGYYQQQRGRGGRGGYY